MDFKEIDNKKVDLFHGMRVGELALCLCNSLGIKEEKKLEIILSAALHDIGKSKIDSSILNKPEKLSNIEWYEMKQHPKYGAVLTFLKGYNENIALNILHHHENFDGTGYPKGLKEKDIPLGASIIRICDSYDAMRSKRPYNRVMTHTEALEELIKDINSYRDDILYEFIKLDLGKFQKYYK